MKRRMQKVLCFMVAIALVWLPFAAPAAVSMQTSDTSMHSMKAESCGHMGQASVAKHAVNVEHAVASISKADCGDCCDNNTSCTCIGQSACHNGTNHASPFIVFTNYSLKISNDTQSVFESVAQYISQIITPDYRPPIV